MKYKELCEVNVTIGKAKSYSEETLIRLKADLAESLSGLSHLEFTIITTGSYGRLEASEESDIDLFIFCDKAPTLQEVIKNKEAIERCVKKYVLKDAGDTGTFGSDAADVFENILMNIGGNNDTNASLTRRMLFLLEGKAIYNEAVFEKYKITLINKYLKSSSEGKIDKYLLNDIIRYYRTITTDFQHKVDAGGKSWGIRNIKLRFSRKLLYFAGIMAIAFAADKEMDTNNRVNFLSKLFDTPALERVYDIAVNYKESEVESLLSNIFENYESFLCCISDREQRRELEDIKEKEDRLNKTIYGDLSRKSISFTKDLYDLLNVVFDRTHPIHTALIF